MNVTPSSQVPAGRLEGFDLLAAVTAYVEGKSRCERNAVSRQAWSNIYTMWTAEDLASIIGDAKTAWAGIDRVAKYQRRYEGFIMDAMQVLQVEMTV